MLVGLTASTASAQRSTARSTVAAVSVADAGACLLAVAVADPAELWKLPSLSGMAGVMLRRLQAGGLLDAIS